MQTSRTYSAVRPISPLREKRCLIFFMYAAVPESLCYDRVPWRASRGNLGLILLREERVGRTADRFAIVEAAHQRPQLFRPDFLAIILAKKSRGAI